MPVMKVSVRYKSFDGNQLAQQRFERRIMEGSCVKNLSTATRDIIQFLLSADVPVRDENPIERQDGRATEKLRAMTCQDLQ